MLSNDVLLDVPMTMTDEDSVIQKYYRLVRFLSAPLILVMVLLGFVVWEMTTHLGFWIFTVGMPLNFLVVHWGISKWLAYRDNKRLDVHRLMVTPLCIVADMADGKREFFEYRYIEDLKLVYSGIESTLFPKGEGYNGAKNEITFKYYGRKIVLQFRLPTRQDYVNLQDVLMYWANQGYHFDEYNSTSGLPVTSYMLKAE